MLVSSASIHHDSAHRSVSSNSHSSGESPVPDPPLSIVHNNNNNIEHPDPRPVAAVAAAAKEEDAMCHFSPPLYTQRAQLVLRVLREHKCVNFVDAGSSCGDLLSYVLSSQLIEHSFRHVMAVDLSMTELQTLGSKLPDPLSTFTEYLHPMHIEMVQGDLTVSPPPPPTTTRTAPWLYLDKRILRRPVEQGEEDDDATRAFMDLYPPSPRATTYQTMDAVISIEVLEHIFPHKLAAYTHTIFAELGAARGARLVLLTTPNRDENARFATKEDEAAAHLLDAERSVFSPTLGQPRRRHDGHFFELTAKQFRRYCDYIIECYSPYWSSYELVGLGDNFTQGAVFIRSELYDAADAAKSSKRTSKGSSKHSHSIVDEGLSQHPKNLSAETSSYYSVSEFVMSGGGGGRSRQSPLPAWHLHRVEQSTDKINATLQRGRSLQEALRRRVMRRSARVRGGGRPIHAAAGRTGGCGSNREAPSDSDRNGSPLQQHEEEEGESPHDTSLLMSAAPDVNINATAADSIGSGDGSVGDLDDETLRATAARVEMKYDKEECIAAFPFTEVFGMSRDAYDMEFSEANQADDDASQESPVVYQSVQRAVFCATSLWDRLCRGVYNAAEGLYKDLLTSCYSPRARSASNGQSQGGGGGGGGGGAILTREGVLFRTLVLEQQRTHTLKPFDCTMCALVKTLRAQRGAWYRAFREDLGRWFVYAKPRRIPPDAPFTVLSGLISPVVPTRSTPSAAVARQWAHAQSIDAIVRPNSAAHNAVLRGAIGDQKEGLALLRALRVSQSGARVHDWLIAEVLKQGRSHAAERRAGSAAEATTSLTTPPQQSLSSRLGSPIMEKQQQRRGPSVTSVREGSPRSKAQLSVLTHNVPSLSSAAEDALVSEDDTTQCAEVLSEEVILIILFMAAVDVLPGATSWLKDVVPRWAASPMHQRRYAPVTVRNTANQLASGFSTFRCSATTLECLLGPPEDYMVEC